MAPEPGAGAAGGAGSQAAFRCTWGGDLLSNALDLTLAIGGGGKTAAPQRPSWGPQQSGEWDPSVLHDACRCLRSSVILGHQGAAWQG
ncbi:Hypothetical predicted protein [Marmota monax]|uniref:Uncharacterized protein n=1 Tax=Marmota monax TaxID=9995 RepID=A0A5E4B6T3_MARMO|nr:hypothetical protein GHT09_004758 [Marmota monax]VTJ64985.1 Hypothetical predicted protein [Marmota monax]